MDLSSFNLMLPTGQDGNPDTMTGDQLSSYQSDYFQMENGQMKFFTSVTGVHSANSQDPRTELAQAQGWKLDSGPHTLSASLTLDQVPSTGDVTIGQVHQRNDIERPPIMINWKNGKVVASVMETNSPSSQRKEYELADNVPLGDKIDYKIDVAPDGAVAIDLNGKSTNFKLDPSFNEGELYFKAGLYVHDNQGDSSEGARATFTKLQIDQGTGASDAPTGQAADAAGSPAGQTEESAKK